jgi:hypothetical protein
MSSHDDDELSLSLSLFPLTLFTVMMSVTIIEYDARDMERSMAFSNSPFWSPLQK